MVLVITSVGQICCIYDEAVDLTALGALTIRRASSVEPDAHGRWWADLALVNGPSLGPFTCRSVALAAELGVDTQGHVVRGRSSPGEEIVTAAREAEADLIVLGSHARRLEGRPYLGANVEHVLEDSDATVVVVILPDDGG